MYLLQYNISMQLCFVSVHGTRETYFVDEPRISVQVEERQGNRRLSKTLAKKDSV
jgi:hypothetical protein